jgi:hypothetical protein
MGNPIDGLAFVSWGLLTDGLDFWTIDTTDPIKTQVLKAVETLLNEIPDLATVLRLYKFPVDLDGLADPVCFFWDDTEDRDEEFYRLGIGDLDLWITVFIKLADGDYQAFNDEADKIAAKIQGKMETQGLLRAAGAHQVQEGTVNKALASETWGELVITFRITYAHNRGDAFSVN